MNIFLFIVGVLILCSAIILDDGIKPRYPLIGVVGMVLIVLGAAALGIGV